ncbi:T9SS type A sorting domain-containing protein [Flavobacterium sp.]|uniref:DUF7619 domain-containing protein n=1 Tax=Flavobacterium sp. TaxID=239 RepID=UPI00121ED6AF|nr:T9SS type A sorting domain-containing protein [Flavobacterium sp.]RZJ73684.1 MAG: T9SS type A sorting domain-containing protein [Flavobacterium sp.]
MNKPILFLILLFAGMANAQTVTIPNPVFRAILLFSDTTNTIAIGSDNVTPIKIDANGDGLIQVSEALAVHQLNLGGFLMTDISGVEAFANLRVLECPNNQLSTLNVNPLVNLTRLNCSGNALTSLDVTALTDLDFLFCENNQIANLNLGTIPELKFVTADGNNLANLTLNGLPKLAAVAVSNNQLTGISLSNLPMLQTLEVSHNQLTSLNVSQIPSLTQLLCFYNQLTSLDLSAVPNLTNLNCGENNITTLNLNGLTNLSNLQCSYLPNNVVINGNNLNALTNFMYVGQNSAVTFNGFPSLANITVNLAQPTVTLNLSGFNANTNVYMFSGPVTNLTVNGIGALQLKAINCSNNQLTALTLNGINALKSLNCSNNKLTSLNLSNLPNLDYLDLSRNKIATLNLSALPNLKHLDCNNNKLSSLNLSALPALEYLDCSNHPDFDIIGNQITSLNLSNLPNLKYFDCSNYAFAGILGALGNQITSLDVNSLTNLEQLRCNKNNISTLVVNNLTHLTHLDVSYNLLTSLDLIGLTDLVYLNFNNNQLSNLNMTGLVNITELQCGFNQIATLNVVNMPNLMKLYCSSNLLTTLNLSGLNQITDLNCEVNQLTTLDVTQMPNLQYLNCNSNLLSNLDLGNVPNLRELHCVGNGLSDLNLNALSQLQHLNCGGNQLANLDVQATTNLLDLFCGQNQLTSLSVNNLPNLRGLDFSFNQISTIDLSTATNLISLDCHNNQLTSLDVSNSPNLYGLYCYDNQITSLDVSNASTLTYLRVQNNALTELLMKNGSFETDFNVANNPNLAYICADDAQLASVQSQLNTLGMTATVSNSYCTFSPGGPYNTVIGTTIFDGNNNGCNVNDPLHPNIRVDFTDGFNTGSAFTNTLGVCTFYADAGNYTLFPNIENASAFNISPASASIDFPNNNYNISNQSFCLSANGVHPDLEIVISPISPARPGFDAVYEIVYKNKGNQVLSGDVTLGFDDTRLDLVTMLPTADVASANNLQWTYTGLLPFESRVIKLEFNVNSPTETPSVNNGDILAFTTAITPVTGDETPSDNTFTFNQVVVNSFDPNDITCLEGELLSPAEIGNYLHYIVNFENTGSASAVNVVVRMQVDESQYDLHSLQVMNTSHAARTAIRGNLVEFIFENIELEAPSDPPVGGHGNVLFKIRSNDGLVQGDSVSRQAQIFFDYNFPIETNNAETIYQALQTPDFADNSVSVYPNPSNGIVNVKSTSEVKSLELFDVQGRLLQQNLNSDSIDISSRSTGLYFLRIKTDKGISVQKISRK